MPKSMHCFRLLYLCFLTASNHLVFQVNYTQISKESRSNLEFGENYENNHVSTKTLKFNLRGHGEHRDKREDGILISGMLNPKMFGILDLEFVWDLEIEYWKFTIIRLPPNRPPKLPPSQPPSPLPNPLPSSLPKPLPS
jgi:hypothetical protein